MQPILDSLNWRYATKQFDTTKKLTETQLQGLIEPARMAPSSFGLQPFKIFVISNPDVRAKLREAAYGQPQVTDSSHLFVFAAATNVGPDLVADLMKRTAEARGIPVESLNGYQDSLNGTVSRIPTDEMKVSWAAKQAYISLGVMVLAAAEQKIDVCPMEGFNAAQFDEILGLKELGYASQVMAAAGFRLDSDPLATAAKVRKLESNFVTRID